MVQIMNPSKKKNHPAELQENIFTQSSVLFSSSRVNLKTFFK